MHSPESVKLPPCLLPGANGREDNYVFKNITISCLLLRKGKRKNSAQSESLAALFVPLRDHRATCFLTLGFFCSRIIIDIYKLSDTARRKNKRDPLTMGVTGKKVTRNAAKSGTTVHPPPPK
jgi:hypothetical protein